MLTQLKEFRAITKDSREVVICADSLSMAATQLEVGDTELTQVSVLRDSVTVDVPDPTVRFRVSITPEAAETAGCVALPGTYLVATGTEVIFQAVEEAGYTFVGWYRDDVLVSEDPVAAIAIVAPAAGSDADEIEARFLLS